MLQFDAKAGKGGLGLQDVCKALLGNETAQTRSLEADLASQEVLSSP